MNARQELLDHIKDREVFYVSITIGDPNDGDFRTISGKLPDVLHALDFDYDEGYGLQELFGNIWYVDGAWSERGEYDGSEWWEYKNRPPLPKSDVSKTYKPSLQRLTEMPIEFYFKEF